MPMTIEPIDALPPYPDDFESVFEPWSKKRQSKGYKALVQAFAEGTDAHAEIMFDPRTTSALAVVSGLNGTVRRLNLQGTVKISRRGDRVFLSLSDDPGYSLADKRYEIQSILRDFADDAEEGAELRYDGDRKLYRSFHHHRTVLCLYNVGIGYDADNDQIILRKKW